MATITVDEKKCVGCGDCTLICPVGVYELRKVDKKPKAFAADIQSCCGLTCRQCMDTCWKTAITITE